MRKLNTLKNRTIINAAISAILNKTKNINQVCEFYKIHPATVYRWKNEYELNSRKKFLSDNSTIIAILNWFTENQDLKILKAQNFILAASKLKIEISRMTINRIIRELFKEELKSAAEHNHMDSNILYFFLKNLTLENKNDKIQYYFLGYIKKRRLYFICSKKLSIFRAKYFITLLSENFLTKSGKKTSIYIPSNPMFTCKTALSFYKKNRVEYHVV